MTTVSLDELKNNPEQVFSYIRAGETIILCEGNQPVAEIKPVDAIPSLEPRLSGLCKGLFTVPDDFDDPLPEEVLAGFENG
jgi:antitoxin (DNA-binding transcriptional repressor) of toxin-antitoxin stability system